MGARMNRHPSGMLSIAMLGTAGLLAFGSVYKVTEVFVDVSRLTTAIEAHGITATPTQDQVDKAMAADKAMAEDLKKANLFAPQPPKRNPVQEVYAILGSEVLINGQWYKAGDKVQDANIVSVQPTHVVVEWSGQRTNLYPIQATVVATDTSSQAGGRSRGNRGGGPGMMGGPTMTTIGGSFGRGGRGGMFGNMSDQERQRFENMSSDERRNFIMQQFGGQGGMRGGMMGGGMGGGGRQRGGGGDSGGGGAVGGGGMQGGGPGGGGGGGGNRRGG